MMEDIHGAELLDLFAPQPGRELPPDVMAELESMLRLHSISAQELFYKWESYSIKMGSEETKLDLDTARAFKTDLFESLERENRTKTHQRNDKRSTVAGTPRNVVKNNGDVFGMLDGLIPQTPNQRTVNGSQGTSLKRKAGFDTPSTWKSTRQPASSATKDVSEQGTKPATFANRPNAGQVIETLNQQLPCPDPRLAPPAEARVKLTANTDLKKFSYRPMAMHLSEASEVLDDRIDEFAAAVQTHYNLADAAFGNAASQSTNEIIAVGRIASDSLDGRLNAASLVLETSRRMGAGLRVPLKVDGISSFEFFPGQIVALRGVNASGEYFSVKEIKALPLLPVPASTPAALDTHRKRFLGGADMMHDNDNDNNDNNSDPRPLNILIAGGPYTADDNLDYEPLHELCEQAATTYADVLILTGPFLDLEHPMMASGDFDLPIDVDDEDSASLVSVFRALVAPILQRLASAVPTITIIMVPAVRDVVAKHVSWPQEGLPRKELGLPKQVRPVSNPVTLSLNEVTVGISAQDVLDELRQSETFGPNPKTSNILARLSRHLIEQRHFFPLFPALERKRLGGAGAGAGAGAEGEDNDERLSTGAMLDTSYLKLGEWLNVRPDMLIVPSVLPPFAKVIESVLVINPGTLSKRKAPGTYARLTLLPPKVPAPDVAAAESEMVGHAVFERARVDVVKI